MIELTSTSLDQTVEIGQRLGELCVPGDVIALNGELGAGKTQLVRGLAQGLGLDPTHVSSPTFVFMHEYTLEDENGNPIDNDPKRPVLVHIDAYRVTGPDDLATLGFDDELRNTSVTAVEWAKLIQPALGDHRLHVDIQHAGNDHRQLALEPHGRWTARLADLQNLAPGQ